MQDPALNTVRGIAGLGLVAKKSGHRVSVTKERTHALVCQCTRPRCGDDSATCSAALSAGRAGGNSAASCRPEHLETEGSAAGATLHRFSLREAGNPAQDYGEGSTPAVCDQIGVRLSEPGGAAGKRVALGAAPDSRWSCMRLGSTTLAPCARLRTATFFLRKPIPDVFVCFVD